MDGAALVELLAAAVRIATPLLFAAMGGLLSERAGTFAVGLEGMMLAGAFGMTVVHRLMQRGGEDSHSHDQTGSGKEDIKG